MNATVKINGIQVTASNLPLPDVSTWFAWFYERNLDYAASGNIVCSDIVATTYIQDVSAAGNASIEFLNAESQIELGDVLAISESNITLDELEPLIANTGSLNYIADSNIRTDDLQLITDIQQISAIGDSYKSVEKITTNTEFAQIYANAEANVQISGIYTQSTYGDVSASATEVDDGYVSINGIQTTITLGTITAFVENDEVFQLSGTPRRYSADQFKSASVKISGIGSKIQAESLIAFGVISISAFANVQSVGIYAEVPTIYAEGILSISEDELILLMAA
jgi:hypothetical protein